MVYKPGEPANRSQRAPKDKKASQNARMGYGYANAYGGKNNPYMNKGASVPVTEAGQFYKMNPSGGPTRYSKKSQAAHDSRPTSSTPKYRDKYGRSISKAEYEKRESYRKRRKKKTADTNERGYKTEMERRKKYRNKYGKNSEGYAATTKTRNQDLALGVSSRYVNKKPKSERSKYQK
jgi:hypothetical protein